MLEEILAAPVNERRTATQLARQQNVSPCTPWRWMTKGIGGIKLPSAFVGSKRVTLQSCFLAWARQISELRDGDSRPPVSSQAIDNVASRVKRAEAEFAD